MFAGPIYYTNVVTSYESPKYISFICDSWMKLRTEIVLEREEDSRAPTRLKYRIYSRAKSYMFRVGTQFHVISISGF